MTNVTIIQRNIQVEYDRLYVAKVGCHFETFGHPGLTSRSTEDMFCSPIAISQFSNN